MHGSLHRKGRNNIEKNICCSSCCIPNYFVTWYSAERVSETAGSTQTTGDSHHIPSFWLLALSYLLSLALFGSLWLSLALFGSLWLSLALLGSLASSSPCGTVFVLSDHFG